MAARSIFLCTDKAPAAVVSLFGRKEYEQCAEDLYFFLQVNSSCNSHTHTEDVPFPFKISIFLCPCFSRWVRVRFND